jgi:hypothetical protein
MKLNHHFKWVSAQGSPLSIPVNQSYIPTSIRDISLFFFQYFGRQKALKFSSSLCLSPLRMINKTVTKGVELEDRVSSS